MSTQQPINNTTETAMIAILGLPVGSALSFDGHTIKLQRDDFVGIHGIPVDKNEDAFHLITVRGGVVKLSNKDENNGNAASITVGFILSTFGQQSTSSLALARKFDPITEEVSSTPLDDMTTSNLCSQIQNQQIEPQRMVSFANAFPTEQVEHWKSQTNYISAKLLQKRGISNGTKIVAGSYGETEETSNQPKKLDSKEIIDGTSVAYPAIPVIDSRKSARHSRHAGTKKYLASLSPSERTALFLDSNPHNYVIEDVLRRYYDNRSEDILGDVQLAYTLFLHLQCLLSLETWRDLVAMLCNAKVECMERHILLYTELMNLLARQVTSIDEDFFEDIEVSGDNFLLPALEQLCSTALLVKDGPILTSRSTLYQILRNRFKTSFGNNSIAGNNHDSTNESTQQVTSMEVDNEYDNNQNNGDGDGDNDEAPIVVTTEEIEASMARSSQSPAITNKRYPIEQYPLEVQKKYPVLFAAKLEHEDIMMTCARALDEQNCVSLVREAGDYLVEEVEPQTEDL